MTAVGELRRGGAAYPVRLLDDPDPPPVLYFRGDPGVIGPATVGIVGTRRATASGKDMARQLGHELAASGVTVVSGLALGIDGAAHRGALAAAAAPPVAVVGTGPDVVYPKSHADLWAQVAEGGLLLSESPPGSQPLPHRFPRRNRIIAGLSDVLVVVESARRGGSMHTVEAAMERGVTVMAVPGSVRSEVSEGTNQLIAAGCPPVCETDDVLAALNMELAGLVGAAPRQPQEVRPRVLGIDRQVLDVVGWEATEVDVIVRRSRQRPMDVLAALDRLATNGWVARVGAAFERR